MRFGIEVKGLEEFERKMRRLKRNLEAIEEPHVVPVEELVTPEFLRKHSKYRSFVDLVRAGGFLADNEALTKEKFQSIPEDAWDEWIRQATNFSMWKAMTDSAATGYAERKVSEGV